MTTRLRRALIAALAAALAVLVGSTGAQAASAVKGSGSTYVGVAMRKWVADGQALGMPVDYTPSGSPTGLSLFNQTSVDFAGTEAEFASIGMAAPTRGYQYVPDVAGAVAIMYNIDESSGRKVDYLHLDRRTVARIFIGEITRWDDPAIVATNRGIHFPSQPIRVVLRGNPSGTTALFYDFISTTLGAEYAARWAQYGCQGVQGRPVLIQCNAGFIPSVVQFNDSDQIANYLATDGGKWSIGFDEFGYAKVYGTSTAWIQNAGGTYVLPYAQNISAALESARLRPDLSQDLSGVYGSGNPQAYPISAYSYIVTQCAPASSRPTCRGAYPDAGKSQTLASWMSYIACDGQVSMAQLGYSPLPPNLSQEMANSVARLTGGSPTTLSAANCHNPRFSGSLGAGSTSPCDPFVCGASAGSSTGGAANGGSRGAGATGGASTAAGGAAAATTGGTAGGTGATTGGTAGGPTNGGTSPGGAPGGVASGAKRASGALGGSGASGATGATGATAGAGGRVAAVAGQGGGAPVVALGGSDASTWQDAAPVRFDAAVPQDPFGWLPAVIVLVVLLAPAVVVGRRRRGGAGLTPGPAPRP